MHVIPRPHSIDKSMEKNNLSGSSFMFVYLNKTCYASIFSNMLSKYMYVLLRKLRIEKNQTINL